MTSRAEIGVDLPELGQLLSASERRALLADLRNKLAACKIEAVSTEIETVPIGSATSKGGDVALVGELIVVLTSAAAYSFYPTQAKELLDPVWKALSKALSKKKEPTVVEIDVPGAAKIKIRTDSNDAALALLPASSAIATASAQRTQRHTPQINRNHASNAHTL